jgi:protein-S-isoprenylcysteine O-methyltransferase Ste14
MREAPPPAPGLVAESTRAGQWLFRWRSYLPLVVLAYLLALVGLHPLPPGGASAVGAWSLTGIVVGLAGFAFRGWTVGHVPMGTSGRGTRELVAESLNTDGVYSAVRHPLYFGNFLMWVGAAVVVGSPSGLVITVLAFWVYYERIMMAEERFLYERFGDAFRAWAGRTPAFLPRLGGWTRSSRAFSLRFALGRDYQALYGLVAATTAVEVTRRFALGAVWLPSAPWRWWFGAGTLAYAVLHLLKRYTRMLEPPDR